MLDTSDAGLQREGWINRTWLALDPLAGTSFGNLFGFKDRIPTSVQVEAYAQNQKERERPAPPPAPLASLDAKTPPEQFDAIVTLDIRWHDQEPTPATASGRR